LAVLEPAASEVIEEEQPTTELKEKTPEEGYRCCCLACEL